MGEKKNKRLEQRCVVCDSVNEVDEVFNKCESCGYTFCSIHEGRVDHDCDGTL